MEKREKRCIGGHISCYDELEDLILFATRFLNHTNIKYTTEYNATYEYWNLWIWITPTQYENMVKKYAAIAAPLKKRISPHKLRSTFGTSLYRETGDIYLVADVLGHSDVNTTRRHYAAMSDSRRRMAAKKVTLRDDEAPRETPDEVLKASPDAENQINSASQSAEPGNNTDEGVL